MASVIKGGIFFGPFQVILKDINVENEVKLKLAHVRGFNLVCSMTPNQRVWYNKQRVTKYRK